MRRQIELHLPPYKKQGKVTLASLLADTISKIDVDTNYLISRIFINQHGSPPNNRGCTNPQPHLPSHEVQAEVLLDTGSLPGDKFHLLVSL